MAAGGAKRKLLNVEEDEKTVLTKACASRPKALHFYALAALKQNKAAVVELDAAVVEQSKKSRRSRASIKRRREGISENIPAPSRL